MTEIRKSVILTPPPFSSVLQGLDKKDGMLRLHGRVLNQPFKKPVPSLFWVSGEAIHSLPPLPFLKCA